MSLPHAHDQIADLIAVRRQTGLLLVALDFDGTLAPIVERPGDAALLEAVVSPLRRLVDRPDTVVAIVSGRGLADVRSRVAVGEIYYAGNHGFEIDGPGVERVHPEAERARPALARCVEGLTEALRDEPGTEVEDKGWTLSIHYRRAEREGAGERVRSAIERHCAGPGLKVTEGKKVFEVRPDVDWDKGRATEFLLDVVSRESGIEGLPAVFIGDDRTDEDAFAVVRERGGGIIVSDGPPAETRALAWVRDPGEVAALIAEMADAD